MNHEAFVHSLTELQDREGKRVSGAILAVMSKLLKKAHDPVKFVKMVKVLRKRLVKEAVLEMAKAQRASRKLGKKLGEEKIADHRAENPEPV